MGRRSAAWWDAPSAMVAIELEHEMRLRGAQAPSFPSIVASGRARRPAARRAPRRCRSRAACWSPSTSARSPGRLLLGLHAHVCHRRARRRRRARSTSSCWRAQQAALAAVAPGLTGREVDAVARDDHRRRRLRRALRPRPRPRRRPGDPRGAAPLAHRRRGAAAAGQRRHRRAGRLPAGRSSACASRISWSVTETGAERLSRFPRTCRSSARRPFPWACGPTDGPRWVAVGAAALSGRAGRPRARLPAAWLRPPARSPSVGRWQRQSPPGAGRIQPQRHPAQHGSDQAR